jgi:hypothetical protein
LDKNKDEIQIKILGGVLMTTFSKLVQSFSEDINSEESVLMNSFEKITSFFFQGAIWTGVPLFIYFIFFYLN